jgi:hypothetical protein
MYVKEFKGGFVMRISIIAGCNRRNSSSTRMARFVGESLKADGHAVDVWDLYSDPLPYYDPDEEMVTEAVARFQHMQVIVRNMHGINCPEWISIGGYQRRFDEMGEPLHAPVRSRVERVLNTFVSLAEKLRK